MATRVHSAGGWLYDPIQPDPTQYPIYKLTQERDEFIRELIAHSIANIREAIGKNSHGLKDELAKTLYQERIRLTQTPWKADAPDEKLFWAKVRKDMVRVREDKADFEVYDELVERIVTRYANEIAGYFDVRTHDFAKWTSTNLISRLLNASQGKGISRFWTTNHNLHDKVHLVGHIDHIRELAKRGTIVMVPTHFSNLDSILIGWAIQSIGLPPFLYGAGLNLFGIKLLSYFMNRLGAYKVDRRKKSLLYLETLKAYSTLSLQRGCHGLFFPGGTRSRSGAIEKRLKLGLLGTALEAQRLAYERDGDKARKLFVVPVIIDYNFVLEAQGLIDQHLKYSGQEQYYVENDNFSTSVKMAQFIYNFFNASSEMAVIFGKPMDLFGNDVDMEGNSLDPAGRHVNVRDYFVSGGEVRKDLQRDAEYTRMLGRRIVETYHRESIIFCSHLVAFAGFNIIKKKFSRLDLYGLLRLPKEDLIITKRELLVVCSNLTNRLRELHAEKEVDIEREIAEDDVSDIIRKGLMNLGLYHINLPIALNEAGDFESQDIKLLLYYHNRLDGYGLEGYV